MTLRKKQIDYFLISLRKYRLKESSTKERIKEKIYQFEVTANLEIWVLKSHFFLFKENMIFEIKPKWTKKQKKLSKNKVWKRKKTLLKNQEIKHSINYLSGKMENLRRKFLITSLSFIYFGYRDKLVFIAGVNLASAKFFQYNYTI